MTHQILSSEEMVGAGHGTKADTLNRFVNLITTAGDTLYGTAAATGARLAIGAANLKKFVNAAGTAPEWASGTKIGTTTRDTAAASGDQAITGVGFKPSLVMLFAADPASAGEVSVGFGDGTLNYCIFSTYTNTAGSWSYYTAAVSLHQNYTTDMYRGTVSALGADGFTISWVKTGSPTGTAGIQYLCFR